MRASSVSVSPPADAAKTSRRARSVAVAASIALAAGLCACSGSSKPSAESSAPAATAAGPASAASAPAASGGSSRPGTATAKSGSFDFCTLITAAEAQAVVGRPVKAGHHSSTTSALGPAGGCVYLSTDTTTEKKTLVNVVFLGNKITRPQFDNEVSSKIGNGQPVPGLGEKAIYFTGVIAVFNHGTALTVQVVQDNAPASVGVLLPLAHKAVDRAGTVR
jgi:hypothetical protein